MMKKRYWLLSLLIFTSLVKASDRGFSDSQQRLVVSLEHATGAWASLKNNFDDTLPEEMPSLSMQADDGIYDSYHLTRAAVLALLVKNSQCIVKYGGCLLDNKSVSERIQNLYDSARNPQNQFSLFDYLRSGIGQLSSYYPSDSRYESPSAAQTDHGKIRINFVELRNQLYQASFDQKYRNAYDQCSYRFLLGHYARKHEDTLIAGIIAVSGSLIFKVFS